MNRRSYIGENNPNYGKKHTLEARQKIGEAARLRNQGENHPEWKGDKANLNAIHEHMRRRIPKPELCIFCNSRTPQGLANKSGEYLRDVEDWYWLCQKCHSIYDGITGTPKGKRESIRRRWLQSRSV